MMGARSKIHTISLNVNINKRKSVDICGYKLPKMYNILCKKTQPKRKYRQQS